MAAYETAALPLGYAGTAYFMNYGNLPALLPAELPHPAARPALHEANPRRGFDHFIVP